MNQQRAQGTYPGTSFVVSIFLIFLHRHAERSPEPLTAAELMNLMRRLQGPNAGHAEDLDEEDFDGHEQEHEHEHDQGYEHADSGDDQGQSYSDGEW